MLNAHQLNIFLTAAETLNFTAAARLLHMTQPSVSQQIQGLEQHFQTELFCRSHRQLQLTEAGAILLPMARQMITLSVQIDETMESLQGEIRGQLKIGCSTTSGKYVLPLLLAAFLQRYPGIQPTCQVTSRRQSLDDLSDGRVHLALAGADEFGKDVEFRRFISDPIWLIAPLNHPWASRYEIEPEELLAGDFILREEGSGTRHVAEHSLPQVGITLDELHTILTLGNAEAIALAVQAGIGVGFVSQIVVRRLLLGGVRPVKVRGLTMEQEVYIGRYTRHPATKGQYAFWQFVTDPLNPVMAQLEQDGLERLITAVPGKAKQDQTQRMTGVLLTHP